MVNVLTGTEDRLLTIDGTVDGHDVEFAFESGASSSVISARSEEKYSLYIRKSNANVQSIFGEVKQVKGITEDLEICVAGRVVFLPLLIIDNQEHDVLLGLNWFKITKAGLFPSEGILTFQKENISLKGAGNQYIDKFDNDEIVLAAIQYKYNLYFIKK